MLSKKHLIILCILFQFLFLTGCATQTRDMQENTQINLQAETPIGPIKLTGTIHRTQHETTELKLNAVEIFKAAATGGFGMMTGGVGVAGLAYGLFTSVKARRRKEDHLTIQGEAKKERDESMAELARDRDVYLKELCKGVSKYMNKAPEEEVKKLKQSFKESMSRDTVKAVEDFI